MGVFADELERVVGGDRLRTMPLRALVHGAGEWDWRRNMPRRTVRRLAGAGYLSASGEWPDVLADRIIAGVADVHDVDSAVAWYVRHALKATGENRREAHQYRHRRFARQQGDVSYYAYRRRIALENGHGSLWYMRKDRGWN